MPGKALEELCFSHAPRPEYVQHVKRERFRRQSRSKRLHLLGATHEELGSSGLEPLADGRHDRGVGRERSTQ